MQICQLYYDVSRDAVLGWTSSPFLHNLPLRKHTCDTAVDAAQKQRMFNDVYHIAPRRGVAATFCILQRCGSQYSP